MRVKTKKWRIHTWNAVFKESKILLAKLVEDSGVDLLWHKEIPVDKTNSLSHLIFSENALKTKYYSLES